MMFESETAARVRIGLTYLWRHGRVPKLTVPTLLTELIQVRKLFDRDPRMPLLADKVTAKAFAASQLGREWVVPLLWSGIELPLQAPVDGPIVVKSRHGCNQNVFVRSGAADWRRARSSSAKWMRGHYGWWLDEWAYAHIPRGLLIEPMIGRDGELPLDYKVFVFGGQATHVQVHLDRERRHRWVLYDRDWHALGSDKSTVARPTALQAMLDAAETLAADFDFVRVDFYQPDEQPLFGEMSFYPGSGLCPIDPPALNEGMGRLWLAAQAKGCIARQLRA
ncbi:hypothetical protein FHS31_000282 [Sphingomonas vulcanisoli]|uniref:Polysaccharide biosynthesis protein n=1 Tax=Sphingomonas vulcanisoli TaxID=1658060 RepID=A0ABX0TSC6_9SPHN|nr:ATP-grasp fold amidoligase family protein [Sphingomonas vulcanisoli]NIJ06700.1 hypothetical protein [Sphingomonas vulcanisoli]